MSPARPRPGDILAMELTASSADAVVLTAFGRDVPMFKVADRFRGLVAVPLHSPSADHPTVVRTTLSDGAQYEFRCDAAKVVGREFRSDTLRVARRYAHGVGSDRSVSEKDEVSTMVAPLPLPLLSLTPFVWPKAGNINATYGERRLFTQRLSSRHLGTDISGVTGERVFASQAGVVRLSAKVRASGETLVVDHGGGVLSHYLHLSKRLKYPGQRVRQGEVIGLVGQTGRVTGPHLHFAVSVHGRYVDPEQVLAHDWTFAQAQPCDAVELATSAR